MFPVLFRLIICLKVGASVWEPNETVRLSSINCFVLNLFATKKKKEKDQLLRAPLAWISTIRRESKRKCKARTVVGRGEEEPAM